MGFGEASLDLLVWEGFLGCLPKITCMFDTVLAFELDTVTSMGLDCLVVCWDCFCINCTGIEFFVLGTIVTPAAALDKGEAELGLEEIHGGLSTQIWLWSDSGMDGIDTFTAVFSALSLSQCVAKPYGLLFCSCFPWSAFKLRLITNFFEPIAEPADKTFLPETKNWHCWFKNIWYNTKSHLLSKDFLFSKICLKWPLNEDQIRFQDQLSLNAGNKYCRMLPTENSAVLSQV